MKKKSQIWVETAIYTLIGLTIIGIVLSISMPQIQKMREKSVVKQAIEVLNQLDKSILDVSDSPGNIRIIPFKISKGKLEIDKYEDTSIPPDSSNNYDIIRFSLENSNLKLSDPTSFGEPFTVIQEGDVYIYTIRNGNRYNINLELRYSDLNLTFIEGSSQFEEKTIFGGGVYKIKIENEGVVVNDKLQLNMELL